MKVAGISGGRKELVSCILDDTGCETSRIRYAISLRNFDIDEQGLPRPAEVVSFLEKEKPDLVLIDRWLEFLFGGLEKADDSIVWMYENPCGCSITEATRRMLCDDLISKSEVEVSFERLTPKNSRGKAIAFAIKAYRDLWHPNNFLEKLRRDEIEFETGSRARLARLLEQYSSSAAMAPEKWPEPFQSLNELSRRSIMLLEDPRDRLLQASLRASISAAQEVLDKFYREKGRTLDGFSK